MSEIEATEIDQEDRTFEEELLAGDVADTLAGLVEFLDIERAEVARRLHVTPSRVSQMLSGGNLTLRSLGALGWAMGYRFHVQPAALAESAFAPSGATHGQPEWAAAARNYRMAAADLKSARHGWNRFLNSALLYQSNQLLPDAIYPSPWVSGSLIFQTKIPGEVVEGRQILVGSGKTVLGHDIALATHKASPEDPEPAAPNPATLPLQQVA